METLETPALIIGALIIVVVVGSFLYYLIRSLRQSAARALPLMSPVSRRPMPAVTEFHVAGDTAQALFSVPLGDAEAGQHLIDLLSTAAIEHMRDMVEEGLPLEGVHRIQISAMRGENAEVLGNVEFPEVGVLPERDEDLPLHLVDNPIAVVQEVVADTSVSAAPSSTSTLDPVAGFIQLSGPTESHLRSFGVDTDTMNLDDLILGLLRVSGYEIDDGRSGTSVGFGEEVSIYGMRRDAQSTMLLLLPHEEGSHPELEDSALARFAVEVGRTNPDQAILVTDKFSPYSMYEREKRNKRLVFITRERLQAFVDSFGLS